MTNSSSPCLRAFKRPCLEGEEIFARICAYALPFSDDSSNVRLEKFNFISVERKRIESTRLGGGGGIFELLKTAKGAL